MTPTGPCSLPPEALEGRLRSWRSLRGAVLAAEHTARGGELRYRLERDVVDRLLELIEAEGRCCPSLSFEATVTLRIEGAHGTDAAAASALVDEAARSAPGLDPKTVEEAVRAHYARAAGSDASCCGPSPGACCGPDETAVAGIGAGVYGAGEQAALPHLLGSSLGCANPVAVAELRTGETVLDLGSGAGIDVLLSARRVGPAGKAYGLDMTDEMLELARQNQAEAGMENAEFLRGHIEAIPLPDASVDVVVSNCVISLSTDKERVFAEAHRVLRPGGRLALADVVAEVEATPEQQADLASWVSCLAGSLTRAQYRSGLEAAGFASVFIDERHAVADGFDSVVVRALKPR